MGLLETERQSIMEFQSELNGSITLTEKDISSLLRALRGNSKVFKPWDLNWLEGKEAETKLASLLTGESTMEVKRDFRSGETGNIPVEFECGGKPSGIATSEAEWWAYCLGGKGFDDEVIVIIKSQRLTEIADSRGRVVSGGDNGRVKMVLLKLTDLLEPKG